MRYVRVCNNQSWLTGLVIFWHGENLNVLIFSNTINVKNVRLCMMVLLTELYLFISLSMT